jgi:hypothetical protein
MAGAHVTTDGISNFHEAIRWTRQTGPFGLGRLPGNFDSWAYDISADGSAIAVGGDGLDAFRWTQETSYATIGH